ncbi:MAG: hypothetical protein CMK59_04395 [Proteobacteria bacterium]|nr:hypothetical protein [Pseudomonadota bacterium]
MIFFLACHQEGSWHPSAYEPSGVLSENRPSMLQTEALEENLQAFFDAWHGSVEQRAGLDIINWYQEAMSFSDASCPQSYEYQGNQYWFSNCTTDQGDHFDGYVFFNTEYQEDVLSDGGVYDSTSLNGAAKIDVLDQEIVNIGGGVVLISGFNIDGAKIDFMAVQGSFSVEKDSVESQELVSMEFQQYAFSQILNGVSLNGYSLNGTMPLQSEQIKAISFAEVAFFDQRFGYPCEEEPIGQISVRDAQGYWYDLNFDVSIEWDLMGVCDGCAQLTQQGDVLGEICLDFSSILEWEDRPW